MALFTCRFVATLVCASPVHRQIRWLSKFDVLGNSLVPISGTYPQGFLVGSTNVGLKPASKDQPDLVLVTSDKPSCGAAVLTKNEFPAASITVTREIVRKTKGHGLRGVIVNSGCANTLTGKAGLEDAGAMSKEADKYVSGETGAQAGSSIMVMHTGVGGQR